MSGMSLQVAIRSIQKKSIEEVYHIAKDFYNREPDDEYRKDYKLEGELIYFSYNGENNNILVNNINGNICLDYMLKDESESYDVNETISLKKLLKIQKWLKKYGFDYEDISYKVFYYYNGGCSGLNEID